MKRKLLGVCLALLLLSGCTATTQPRTEQMAATEETTFDEAEVTAQVLELPATAPETTEDLPAATQAPSEQPERMQPVTEIRTAPPTIQPTQIPTVPQTEAPQTEVTVDWDTEDAVAQICADCNAYIVSIGCTADATAACWVSPQYTRWEGSSAVWLRNQLIAGIDYYKSTGVVAMFVTYEADPRGGFLIYLNYAV